MDIYNKVLNEIVKRERRSRDVMMEMGFDPSILAHWKNGKSIPSDRAISVLAEYFGWSLEELDEARKESLALRANGQKKRKDLPMGVKGFKIPLITSVCIGDPDAFLAYKNVKEMIPLPPFVQADFAMRCVDDTMANARIFKGDVVYFRRQSSVGYGEIAAVLIGDTVTLRWVYSHDDNITLVPMTPVPQPGDYYEEDGCRIMILGKAVAVTGFLNGEGK